MFHALDFLIRRTCESAEVRCRILDRAECVLPCREKYSRDKRKSQARLPTVRSHARKLVEHTRGPTRRRQPLDDIGLAAPACSGIGCGTDSGCGVGRLRPLQFAMRCRMEIPRRQAARLTRRSRRGRRARRSLCGDERCDPSSDPLLGREASDCGRWDLAKLRCWLFRCRPAAGRGGALRV